MVKKLEPESILRGLQKRARERVLSRDGGRCVVCGSRERLEAAHVVAPPINYFSSHAYESGEEFEGDAAPFYGSTNMVLLCRKCHMIHDYRRLLQEFAAEAGPEKATELVAKVLIDAGVSLEELKGGGHERVLKRVIEYMFDIYGPGWKMIFEELDKVARKKAE